MLLWSIAVAATLAGLALLVLGVRGRRFDDHPVCRRCRFDLVGVETSRCPECGRDLAERKAVRIGNRRRRPAFIACGALLSLISLTGVGILGWAAATNHNWLRSQPEWMLFMRLNDARGETDPDVLTELTRRAVRGRLSDSSLRTLAHEGLVRQGTGLYAKSPYYSSELALGWHIRWGDLIVAAIRRGVLGRPETVLYARNAMHHRFEASPIVPADGALRMLHSVETLDAGNPPAPISVHVKTRGVYIDNKPVAGGDVEFVLSIWDSTGGYGARAEATLNGVEPGMRRLAVVKQFEIYQNCRARRDLDSHDEEPYIVWHEVFERDVEVLPTGSPATMFITDPEHEPAMREAARAMYGIVHVIGGHALFPAPYPASDPPLGFAHDVLIETSAGTIPITTYIKPVESRSGQFIPIRDGQEFHAPDDTVTVRLRLNAAAARRYIDIYRVWGGDIVLADVPVLRFSSWEESYEHTRRRLDETRDEK